MNKIKKYKIVDYGFNDIPEVDARLEEDGYNEFTLGFGFSQYESLKSAMELLIGDGIKPSKDLFKELNNASKQEDPEDKCYNLAIVYFIDQSAMEQEFDDNIEQTIEMAKLNRIMKLQEEGMIPDLEDIAHYSLN